MSFAATILGLGHFGAYLKSLGKEGGEKIYLLKHSEKTSLTVTCPKWRRLKTPQGGKTELWVEELPW